MNFFRKLVYSFFSPDFYNAEARQEKGIGAQFIAALSAVIMLVAVWHMQKIWPDLRAGFDRLPAVMSDLPVVTIKDHKLSIDKPVPYTVPLGGTDFKFVIDTGYKAGDLAALKEKMVKENIFLFVTQDAFIGRGNDDKLEVHNFDKAQDVVVTHESWMKLAEVLNGYIGVMILIGALSVYAGIFIFNLIATFLSAVVTAILSALLRAGVEFDAAMRLTAAARVPATIFAMLPFVSAAVGWLFWFAYLVFGVWSCRATRPVIPPPAPR